MPSGFIWQQILLVYLLWPYAYTVSHCLTPAIDIEISSMSYVKAKLTTWITLL